MKYKKTQEPHEKLATGETVEDAGQDEQKTHDENVDMRHECPTSCYVCTSGSGTKNNGLHAVRDHMNFFNLEIKDTCRCGKGVFTPNTIPKGTIVAEYTGKLLSYPKNKPAACMSSYCARVPAGANTKTSERICFDGASEGNESRYFNHSCEPNCLLSPRTYEGPGSKIFNTLVVETTREIEAGEQLMFNYGEEFRQKPCLCNSCERSDEMATNMLAGLGYQCCTSGVGTNQYDQFGHLVEVHCIRERGLVNELGAFAIAEIKAGTPCGAFVGSVVLEMDLRKEQLGLYHVKSTFRDEDMYLLCSQDCTGVFFNQDKAAKANCVMGVEIVAGAENPNYQTGRISITTTRTIEPGEQLMLVYDQDLLRTTRSRRVDELFKLGEQHNQHVTVSTSHAAISTQLTRMQQEKFNRELAASNVQAATQETGYLARAAWDALPDNLRVGPGEPPVCERPARNLNVGEQFVSLDLGESLQEVTNFGQLEVGMLTLGAAANHARRRKSRLEPGHVSGSLQKDLLTKLRAACDRIKWIAPDKTAGIEGLFNDGEAESGRKGRLWLPTSKSPRMAKVLGDLGLNVGLSSSVRVMQDVSLLFAQRCRS